MMTGSFRHRVTILAPPPSSPNEWNEEANDPPIETPAWAAMKSAPGTERFQSGENAALAPSRFFFRWRPGLVKPTDRIRHEETGLEFDVKSVEEVGRRLLLQVIAVARVAA
jgi:head-tail adaptor